ncbi:MAG: hypothetical protein U1F54_18880 [Burkholderiales bacterium]
MDALMLAFAAAVAWLPGVAALLALRRASPLAPGEGAWTAGVGFLVGAFALTVWMRILSRAGVPFGVAVIALPLLAAGAVALALAWRRDRFDPRSWAPRFSRALLASDLTGGARILWIALLAWLAARFALLAMEVLSRPLYPWDAWTQWATKARVWYELGTMVPFARVADWYDAGGRVYFDASPEYPPTMPLLQVWNCLALGRWDDVLMNAPWVQMAVALALAAYGGLRLLGTTAVTAMVGAFLVASLPLANVHVALAGYSDLPLAAYYAAAALALLRWSRERGARNAAVVIVLAIACTQIKNPGWFWAATLVPGALVVLVPRHGLRLSLVGFAIVAFALAALARLKLTVFNYRLDLNFDPPWRDLFQSYFLLGNWNLLWFGVAGAVLLARRELLAKALVPLTTVVIGGILFLFFVFGFTNASEFIADQTTVNRATLHLAPLMVCFMTLAFDAFSRRAGTGEAPAPAPTEPAADDPAVVEAQTADAQGSASPASPSSPAPGAA